VRLRRPLSLRRGDAKIEGVKDGFLRFWPWLVAPGEREKRRSSRLVDVAVAAGGKTSEEKKPDKVVPWGKLPYKCIVVRGRERVVVGAPLASLAPMGALRWLGLCMLFFFCRALTSFEEELKEGRRKQKKKRHFHGYARSRARLREEVALISGSSLKENLGKGGGGGPLDATMS